MSFSSSNADHGELLAVFHDVPPIARLHPALAKWWGPVVLSMSAVLLAIMAVFVRMAGYHHIPGSETTLVRFGFGIIAVLAMHHTGVTRLVIRRPALLAVRGLTGGLSILCYFISLAAATGPGKTTLTNSVLLGNSFFIFTPVFGAIFIREKLRPAVIAAVVVAFAGIYLVVSPKFGGVSAGDVYGLLSAVFAGLALVVVRELRRTESATVIFLALCVIGTVLAAIALPFRASCGRTRRDGRCWALLQSYRQSGS
jgi:drug/metabolite transporter (DMT)-like permease